MSSGVRNFLLTFLISLVLFSVIAFGIFELAGLTGGDSNSAVVTGFDIYTDSDNSNNALVDLDGNSFNMLFLGVDYSPSLFYSSYNPNTVEGLVPYDDGLVAGELVTDGAYRRISADTILLVCVSKERKEFAFTALSPNTLVKKDEETKCLGDIFEDDGLPSLVDAVHNLTGVPIDRYAVVGLDDFASVLDIIEGVDFNVPCRMVYDDNKGGLHINLSAGYQYLDGAKALDMLRFNSYEDPAYSRLKTTAAFARAVAAKVTTTAYITKAPALFKEAASKIVTDFTASDLNSNLDLIFSYPNFTALTIELPGTYSTIDGKLCFIPNETACVNTMAPYKRAN